MLLWVKLHPFGDVPLNTIMSFGLPLKTDATEPIKIAWAGVPCGCLRRIRCCQHHGMAWLAMAGLPG
jgi:hypothetical protein